MTVHFADGSSVDRGGIIQVKQSLFTGTFYTASNSYVNTGLSVTITPTSTSSRLVAMGHAVIASDQHAEGMYKVNGGGLDHIGVSRGSRTRCLGFMGNDFGHGATAHGFTYHTSFIVMGHPNTTSSTDVHFQMASPNNDGVYLGRDPEDPNHAEGGSPVCSMIIMEISDGAFVS